MSGTLLQILGFAAILLLFATVLLRPDSLFLAALAIGLVVAGVALSWHDVELYRSQKAAAHDLTVFVPSAPREYPRSGS
ncbi:MAG TPA: hypothetical protein VGR70_06470 [Stellaceae bacterium]|nr:hypothetical protein [Stellaceae bacterium]